jgi:hypothetical protein
MMLFGVRRDELGDRVVVEWGPHAPSLTACTVCSSSTPMVMVAT